MGVRIDQVNLVTPDVAGALDFYRLLGVEFPSAQPEWADWGLHHRNADGQPLGFDIDSRAFASAYWASEELPSGWMVNLRTDTREEVDELYERLTAAGYRGVKPPFDAGWGARFAVVLGPSGEAWAWRVRGTLSSPPRCQTRPHLARSGVGESGFVP